MGKDCKYCGAYISDIVDVCPACGRKVKPEKPSGEESGSWRASSGAAQQAPREENSRTENTAYTYKQEYERRYGEAEAAGKASGQSGEVRWSSMSAEDEDVRRNKAICYLCYLGPLFLIPYLTRRDSDFVRFHSNQGLLLLLANVICRLCGAIPVIGWMIKLFGVLYVIGGFFGGLSNVSKGIKKPLPIIGEIKILN